jgi:hypothetical protein
MAKCTTAAKCGHGGTNLWHRASLRLALTTYCRSRLSRQGPGRKPLAAKFKAEPAQILPGWEEALEGMQMGQTRVIQVPPALAYGEKGLKIPTKDGEEFLVPPNERLQFEITLVQVSLPPP